MIRSTIIVVDDDSQVLRSLSFLLETEGYSVLTFNSASELLDYGELPEDVCLLVDYRMPGMSGLELLVRLREKYPEIPALIITGYPDDAIESRAGKLGISVIRKPHLDDGLLDGIRDVLSASSA